MIEEFEHSKLNRRRAFLESRARSHLAQDTDQRWHVAAAATLLRDAAAVALILGDASGARPLLQESGKLFIGIGLIGGLQLLYVAGALDADDHSARDTINAFSRAFVYRFERDVTQMGQPEVASEFINESFQPSQLLRAYQGLAGRLADKQWLGLQNSIRRILTVNATMPVGPTRVTLATYLGTFDQLAAPDLQAGKDTRRRLGQVLTSFAQRREELLAAARSDRFHWKALLRPAELVDFDLLALLLIGVGRGKTSSLIDRAFAGRDPLTALPQALAIELNRGVIR